MPSKDDLVITWLIPALMTATLSLVGWISISINHMSESLAVVTYRIEANSLQLKEAEDRIHHLELYAVLRRGKSEPTP